MFPLSHERSTMLRHTYSVCFVSTIVNHIKGGPRIAWVWGRLYVKVKVVPFHARKDIRGVEV